MPNTIKYGTEIENNTLKKGNFVIGVNNVDYGPTNETGYHNTITPPSGGYVVYKNRGDNERSIYVAESDEELVLLKDDFGATGSTANDILVWAAQQSDVIILNNPLDNIVTDGLVLCLDAGFTCSYPKSNTTWYDLSGNNYDGVLSNGPTFSDGSIVFDGTNDYVSIGYKSGLFAVASDQIEISVESFVYFNTSSIFQPIWQIGGVVNSAVIGITDTNKARFIVRKSTSGINVPKVDSTTTINTGQWYHLAASKTDSNMTIYVNGISEDSISTTYVWNTGSNTSNWLGQTDSQSGLNGTSTKQIMDGKIATLKIYDRGLSESEILQNYNAQKSRFGL